VQFAESRKPGMCALDGSAMLSKPLFAFYASTGDTSGDYPILTSHAACEQ
jgi:hypothetical protein